MNHSFKERHKISECLITFRSILPKFISFRMWSPEEFGETERIALVHDHEWEDITLDLIEECKQLSNGKMVHGPDFDLFEAMSALELMDPKMDPRYQAYNHTSLEKALSNALEYVSALSDESITTLLDQLICHEVDFWNGQTLAHSVYLFIYAQDPTHCPSDAIRVYTLATLHCCSIIASIIQTAQVFAEEDFIGYRFDRDLSCGTDPSIVINELKVLAEKTSGRLGSHLRFRISLLRYLLDLTRPGQSILFNFTRLQDRLNSMQCELESLHTDSINDLQLKENFFFEDLALSMLTTSPPRPIAPPAYPDALNKLRSIISNLSEFSLVFRKSPATKPLDEYFDDFQYFSSCLSLDIVSRSLLLLLLGTESDFMDETTLPKLSELSLLHFNPLLKSITNRTHSRWTQFSQRVTAISCLSFSLLCNNRSRQRRRLPGLLRDWAAIQMDALEIDSVLGVQNGCFAWVFDQSLRFQVLFLQLGIELGVYALYDYVSVYWYIESLLSMRLKNRWYCQKLGGLATFDHVVLQGHALCCRANAFALKALELKKYFKIKECIFGSEEIRFQHRFKAFNQMVQPIAKKHSELLTAFNGKTESDCIKVALEAFKLAKNCFETAMKSECSIHQKKELKALLRVCISNSVFLMSFKKHYENVVSFDFLTHTYYPIFVNK